MQFLQAQSLQPANGKQFLRDKLVSKGSKSNIRNKDNAMRFDGKNLNSKIKFYSMVLRAMWSYRKRKLFSCGIMSLAVFERQHRIYLKIWRIWSTLQYRDLRKMKEKKIHLKLSGIGLCSMHSKLNKLNVVFKLNQVFIANDRPHPH